MEIQSRKGQQKYMLGLPGGKYYSSNQGQEVGADLSRLITLAHAFDFNSPYQKFLDSGEFSNPVPWDRDAGDKLVAGFYNSSPLDWGYMQIQFLQDPDGSIPLVGPTY